MADKQDVGTVKWLDKGYGVEGDGWNAWINGNHYVSYGIRDVTEWVENQIPGPTEWVTQNGKSICRASTKVGKLSKKDQD